MTKWVMISKRSKKLIRQFSALVDDATLQEWTKRGDDEIQRADLIAWLEKKINADMKSKRLMLETLRGSLLADLHESFLSSTALSHQKDRKPVSWITNAEFKILVVAGSILAICTGFSGITAILGTFAIPTMVVVGAGLVVAGISLALFYHFDRVEMSKILGTKLKRSHELLDVCNEEVLLLNKLRNDIDDCYADTTDTKELQALHEAVKMLVVRYGGLNDVRKAYLAKLNNPYLKTVQFTIATIEGGFVLGSGFFAGKSLGLAVATFCGATAATAFWPILAASLVLSAAAFSVYWFVQRPGFQNRIGGLLGFHKDKIVAFADSDVANQQTRKLRNLEKRVADKLQVLQQIEQLSKKIERFAPQEQPADQLVMKPRAGSAVRHSFFKRSHSVGELNLDSSFRAHVEQGVLEMSFAP